MGNEAWSKIQLHGNLELKNLMALYILTLRTNLEDFLESIVYIIYIFSKLRKSEVQRFKRFANQSWNEEVITIWRQCTKLEGHFEMISKFNLWFRNSTYDFEIQLMNSKSTSKWHQFRIHPLPFWCFTSSTSGIASIQLMNSKWHQFRIHPLPLWCFTSFTLGIAYGALHPP